MRIQLPDRDLAYLPEEHPAFRAYLRDLQLGAAVRAAQPQRDDGPRADRAQPRRLRRGRPSARSSSQQRINSHHNFTQQEQHFGADVWVTRKGAIKARRGMWAMIPGSMGTRSYIVVGKENPMSFHSAPHGAGRRYSRTKARALFNMDDLGKAMEGIEFRHSKVLLDEIPGAYKDIDEVMAHARDLVEVKLRPQAVHQRQGRLDRRSPPEHPAHRPHHDVENRDEQDVEEGGEEHAAGHRRARPSGGLPGRRRWRTPAASRRG